MVGKSDIRAGGAFVELFVKGAKFEAGLKKFSSQLNGLRDSAQAVGQRLAAIGVAAGAVIGASVKRFADFDDQMRSVAAVSQSTDAELAMLTETAKQLGATTSFTAVQVASLMTELGRAGFTASEVDKMTGAVLALARATGTDATLSSGIMSATIRQFGLDASQAGRIADAFTVAANKSFTSVEQLGEALSYAGPDAKNFNMSIEDTLAILGGLGNVGIQGSNAGTALRRLLVITGAEAEKLKEIFGVSFLDAAGDARPLVDVLGEVNEATKDLGTGERAQKLNDAFGLLGITAATAIGGMVGDINALKTSLDNASGTAEKTAQMMDAGLGGSFRILLSSIEGVAIAIGTALAPTLQKIAAVVVDIAGKMKAWIDNNRELAVVIAGAVAGVTALGFAFLALGSAIGLAAFSLSSFAGLLGGLVSLFSAPIAAIVVAGTAIQVGLAGAIIHASGVMPQLVKALSPLLGAIRSITVAVGGGEFSRAWEIAATAVKYFGSLAKDLFSQIPEFAAYAAGKMLRAFIDANLKIGTFLIETVDSVFTAILESARNFANDLVDAMFSGDFVGAFGRALEDAANAINSVVIPFDAGFNDMQMFKPQLDMSDATKDLRDALKQMTMQESPEVKAAKAASAAASVGTGALLGGATTPGKKPEIDPSALDKYKDRVKELKDALASGAITQKDYDAGLKQMQRDMLDIADPIQDYCDRVALLDQALKDGAISADQFQQGIKDAKAGLIDQTPIEDYRDRVKELKDLFAAGIIDGAQLQRGLDAAKDGFVDKTPIERYMARLKELKELFDAGIINRKQFETAQMDALPDKVKAIIDRSKTPLEKFNEQITEARDFFSKGLITEGQFAKEQERLQKEFREEEKKGRKAGEVSVSFSSAALIAQGMGARGGKDVLGSKMEQQISETKAQTDVLKGIRQDLGKNRAVFS